MIEEPILAAQWLIKHSPDYQPVERDLFEGHDCNRSDPPVRSWLGDLKRRVYGDEKETKDAGEEEKDNIDENLDIVKDEGIADPEKDTADDDKDKDTASGKKRSLDDEEEEEHGSSSRKKQHVSGEK
ncbi:hypothetical protein QBC41DRAFT_333946 [Cercophora samala]|uniref:Uncharacterized protein n=1 Tax=Cercophora samala TaxID=330535 RepID=A0AA39ZKY5_9PEZI|nr:hypothetical protein QBC41DRAFT_333946 [Cercophora samala]